MQAFAHIIYKLTQVFYMYFAPIMHICNRKACIWAELMHVCYSISAFNTAEPYNIQLYIYVSSKQLCIYRFKSHKCQLLMLCLPIMLSLYYSSVTCSNQSREVWPKEVNRVIRSEMSYIKYTKWTLLFCFGKQLYHIIWPVWSAECLHHIIIIRVFFQSI